MRFRIVTIVAALCGAAVIAVVVFFVLSGGEDEADRVARASDAANTAIQSHDFEALQQRLATEVQESSSAADLEAQFGELETTLGSIVAVERLGEPVVEGETAVVETEVTYGLNGERSTRVFYDLYVLENGEWRLAYSEPKEDVAEATSPGTNE